MSIIQNNISRLQKLAQNGVVTHRGHFHADDILSAALLKIAGVIPDVHVVQRIGRVAPNFNGLAFDIGEGEFDHHQEGATFRENGVKYASFGLIWNSIGAEYVMKKYDTTSYDAQLIAKKFDDDFVASMDLTDNFGQSNYPNTLAFLIGTRNNGNFVKDQRDDLFYELSDRFCVHLESMIKSAYESIDYKNRAIEISNLNTTGIVFFGDNVFIPRSAFIGTKIKCLIKFSRGAYNVTTIEPYKIDPSFIKMPGCIQVWETGAAFKTLVNAKNAATAFVKQNNNSK